MRRSKAVTASSFEFDGVWGRTGKTLLDGALRWIWTGMPRVPALALKSTFYLYKSLEDAELGRSPEGTGFLIGVPLATDPSEFAIYAATNWHVAVQGPAPVVRLHKEDGRPHVFDLDCADWVFKPAWHDLAIAPLAGITDDFDVGVVPTNTFVDPDMLREKNIGPGEDVFMCGLFVDALGSEGNAPAVRFGNISMMPVKVPCETGASMESYCLDLRSRTGFSGSPVWVYRKFGSVLDNGNLNMRDQFVSLLGVHWGQFRERNKLTIETTALDTESVRISADKRFIDGMSGMTCAVPASAIIELLQHPRLRAFQKISEDQALSSSSAVIAE